jgi:predicted 3-demethylubiquinone-9 3-methyltransferase (glyoxalase superfamily)
LWFDNQAEEAMHFYTSIFKNSKGGTVSRFPRGSAGTRRQVMSVTFQLGGHEFMALNGGPLFKFTEAISFFVNCETQEEVGQALRGRKRKSMRLAEGQIRFVLADCSHGSGQNTGRSLPRESEKGHAGHA